MKMCVLIVILLAAVSTGCSDSGVKNSDPKVAPGSKPPPGLKEAGIGVSNSGGTSVPAGGKVAP